MQQRTKKQASDQGRAFRKAARELGCEDNEERFQAALRTVAKAKPRPEKGLKRRASQPKG
jgi:hypothetical protein